MPEPIPPRLLVVDDNTAIHEDFLKILTPPAAVDAGFEALDSLLFGSEPERSAASAFRVDTASQGEEAVDLVGRAVEAGDPYAVAFVDVRMPPGIDGIETLGRIWRLDPHVQAVVCTAYSDRTWEEMVDELGRRDGVLVIRKPFDVIEVKQAAHALVEKWRRRRESSLRVASLEAALNVRDRELSQVNGLLHREVAQRRATQQHLQRAINHDPVTGLPNRQLAQDRLARAIDRANRQGRSVGVISVALDGLVDVRESLGQPAAEAVTRQQAERVQRTVRSVDTVADFGGQLLVVLLEELEDPAEVAHVTQRIVQSCGQPIEVGGHSVRVPPTLGVALYPGDGGDVDGMLSSADLALEEARRRDRPVSFFARELEAAARERLALRSQLDLALERDELDVFYQPLVDPDSGEIRKLEALVRWRHPVEGVISPAGFIAEAERSGHIVAIGERVLRLACAQVARWIRAGHAGLAVAVNVSPRQLGDPDFVPLVASCVTDHRLPAGALELEITETSAIGDFDRAQAVLGEIAALGVPVVIDDFGTGYSSLTRLHELPISAIKLDRFFVRDADTNPKDAAIVTAIASMANALGLETVAEGVETESQLAFLRGLRGGPDLVQGFLFSRPVPAEEATRLLAERGRPRSVPRAVSWRLRR